VTVVRSDDRTAERHGSGVADSLVLVSEDQLTELWRQIRPSASDAESFRATMTAFVTRRGT